MGEIGGEWQNAEQMNQENQNSTWGRWYKYLESGLDLDPDLDFSWIQSPDQGIFPSSLIFPWLKVKNLVKVPNRNQGPRVKVFFENLALYKYIYFYNLL